MPTLRRNTNEPACSRDGHAEVIATNHGHVLQVVIPKLFWDFFSFLFFLFLVSRQRILGSWLGDM